MSKFEHVKSFLKDAKQRQMSAKTGLEADLTLLARKVEGSVEQFLMSNNLVSGEISATEACAANEGFAVENIGSMIGFDSIEELIRSAGIAEQHIGAAVEQVGIILHRHVGFKSPSSAWSNQLMAAESLDNHVTTRELSSLYPSSITAEFGNRMNPSQEAFGVNINMAIPDMKVAITVAIMRFHTGMTPRVMPIRTTAEPMIQYLKSHMEVFNVGDMDQPPSRLVDLYEDPTPVRNELQVIIPRKANDEADPNSVLIADGVVRFGVKANVLKLSVDPDKFGHTKINRTDIVADGVKVKSVIIDLTVGGVTEQFEVAFPATIARLTRPSNAKDSADRNADLEFAVFLNKETKTSLGEVSTLLAAFDSVDEGLALRVYIKPSINLKSGVVHALCSVSAKAHNRVNLDQLSTEAINAAGTITNELIGYTLDAKFSEENIRKSNIAIRTHRQPFAYDIPTGRNYIYDYALGQQNPEENAANLTKVIRIGQDDIVLKVIRETLGHIYDLRQLFAGNPLDPDLDPGRDYVAGSMVRPYCFLGSLDVSKIAFEKSADRSGDIKQFFLTYLTAVTEEIMLKTFYKQQLADGAAVTFKLITGGPVLGNIIGARHIHNHLNTEDSRGGSGVEYKLVLDNGTVCEVVTGTFNYLQNTIILIPVINDSTESVLNFAHNWDYGTMVAHYTPGLSGESSHNRLFANAREMPIVTNPMGAIIDIVGMDEVTFLEIPEETTP